MADKNKNVNIEITAKDKASAALKSVGKEINDINEKSKALNKTGEGLGSAFSGMVSKLAGLAAGYLAVNKVLSTTINFMKNSVALYKTQEQAEAQLTTAIGYKSTALMKYASELQKVTTFGDETIIQAQSMAAAFIKDEEQIKMVTKAAADLAAAKGISLVTATNLITKSIVSETNALKEHGISMTASTDQTERLNSLTKNLTKSFGGMAEALAATDLGKIQQMDNAISDYSETIGKKLTPALRLAKEGQLHLMKSLDNTILGIENIGRAIKGGGLSKASGVKSAEVGAEAKATGGIAGIDMIDAELADLQKKYDYYTAKFRATQEEYIALSNTGRLVEANNLANKLKDYRTFLDGRKAQMDALKAIQEEIAQSMMDSTTIEGTRDYDAEVEAAKKAADEERAIIQKLYDYSREMSFKDAQARWEAKEQGLQNEFDMFSDYSARQVSIEDQTLKSREALKSAFEARGVELQNRTLDGRINSIVKSYEDELTLNKMMLDQKIIDLDQYNQRAADLQKDYNEKEWAERIEGFSSMSNTITEIATTMMSSIQAINDINTQKELADLADVTESRKKSATKNIANKKLLEKELEKIDKEAEQKRKEIAKREKQIALVMAIINTAQGVTKALASSGPPLNFIMAALTGVAGAIQVGLIASQAFAQGGIVQAASGVPTTGDQTTIRVNPGEMVLNKQQQTNLLALANNAGSRGGGSVSIQETIIVQGNMDSTAIDELKQHREAWLEMLRDSNKALGYRGYTYAT